MLQDFPSLTQNEFEEACRMLEHKCHDNLHETNWQSVSWDNSGELLIRQASKQPSRMQVTECAREDVKTDVEGDDDGDMEAMQTIPTHGNRPVINFSIVLSATYRVPVLYFALSSSGPIRLSNLDEIYSCIVSPQSHGALQRVGVMGGISIANHPLTDKPMFFVHPCVTLDTLSAMNDGSSLDPFMYLLLWFGIVGAAVGLHVPSKIVA